MKASTIRPPAAFAPNSLRLIGTLAAACLVCFSLGSIARGQVNRQQSRVVPPASYYLARMELSDGELDDALKDFQAESRSAIKTPQSSWIDSICFRAMMGEAHYHMGNYPQALDQYNAALQLYVAFSDWLLRVNFITAIQPDTGAIRRSIPWGSSKRRFKLGKFPDTMQISQGRINNNAIVAQGGVVQRAVMFPINAHEIVRCTALALRRRRELMGPVCKLDPFTGEILSKLQRRPGPQNWSEAWIDLQLGLAHASADQMAQAQQLLQRSVVAGGEYDHPLTCVAMLELGRLAKDAGDFDAAEKWFEEASYSAVYFENATVLEEAFRLGLENHLMANKKGIYPPLVKAASWVRSKRLRHLQAWLSTLLAENLIALGNSKDAVSALKDAQGVMGRRAMASGVVGARNNYLTALVNYQRAQTRPAAEALNAALAFKRRGGSLWMFQISLADNLYVKNAIAPRVAVDLYKTLLRDPAAGDWTRDPFDSLAVLAIPHSGSYENWFDAALRRKEIDTAIEVADRARRHRFHSTLEMGGRLLSLRWVLHTPPAALNRAAALQRQDLLVRYPNYDQLAQQAGALENELRRQPLVRQDMEETREQGDRLEELAKVGLLQEGMLREMALRREPVDLVFPPIQPTTDIQTSLPEGHAVMVFFATSRGMHAFMISRDHYTHWNIGSLAVVQKGVAKLLREMGNYDENRELSLPEIHSAEWRDTAGKLIDYLLRDSQVDLSRGIDELVIVPDGLLWYLPFEALPINSDSDGTMLSHFRIRYVPTFSLSIPDRRPRRLAANTAVVVGKLFPRDKEEVAVEAFEQLRRSVPSAVALTTPLPAPSPVYSVLMDRLIVLDDVDVDAASPYGWAPIGMDRGKEAGALAGYFPLPWGGPEQIVLPGFHTSAEHSMKKRSETAPGQEVFLSVCGMMAGGARTILLSRWRMGGRTSFDLVREFVQEMPFTQAADAWQRSVELATERTISSDTEPRLKRFDTEEPPTAAHPLFWSGYMLVDTGAAPQPEDAPREEKPPALKFKGGQNEQAARAEDN